MMNAQLAPQIDVAIDQCILDNLLETEVVLVGGGEVIVGLY